MDADTALNDAVRASFELGWTTALLYTDAPPAAITHDQLVSTHELDPRHRTNLEMMRLDALVTRLQQTAVAAGATLDISIDKVADAWWGPNHKDPVIPPEGDFDVQKKDLHDQLPEFNVDVLTALAQWRPEPELAYQLGRSLRDSVNPTACALDGQPRAAIDRVMDALNRTRVTKIQEWLAVLAEYFPTNAARVVRSSVGRWCDFARVSLDKDAKDAGRLRINFARRRAECADEIVERLLPQGDTWHALLAGERSTEDLLTPEAYVHAGETALRRTGRLMRMIVVHNKFVIAATIVLLGAVLFAGTVWLDSLGKVVTWVGTAGAALGLSYKGIGASAGRIAGRAETPIFKAEEVEAMAWTISSFPPVSVTSSGVRYLRDAGITARAPLGIS